MRKSSVTMAAYATLVWAGAALAASSPPPATSLNNCQNAVKAATATFVKNKVAAVGACLQAVSTQIVKNNAGDASGAAASCVTQFRKINDTRALHRQLSDKLAAAIVAKCAPGQPHVTHTLADIIGSGADVPQPLDAENLNAWCSHYGGDGSIDSLQEWIDCLTAAAECDVDSSIAAQYPRVLDWLNLVQPKMQALAPPVTDPNKITDAVAGLDAVKAEIDPNNDNVVGIQCGGIVATGIVATGTAAVGDVLAGKTFSNSTAGGLTGTMPNNGAVTLTPTSANQTIAAGYHNGAGYCAGDANLVSGNIKSGATIFGVSGNPNVVNTSSGTATAGDLLSGKVAWVAGAQVTGTMPNNGAVTLTPTTTNQTIAAGYHNGSGYCAGDAHLVTGNIKSGATIFGVSGNSNVVNTSGATATASNIVSGQTCYANGSLVTGSATAGSNVNGGNGLKTFTIPDGLYSGSKTATANDTNLVGENIVTSVSIFGVAGTQPPSQPLKTGQTTAYGTGSDGNLQKGDARSFTDNGDGTITDNKTGLMWEKKDQSGGIHDMSNSYTWCGASCDSTWIMDGTITTTFLAALNGGGGFAGHTDWRIPNQNELLSLVNYQNVVPAVDTAFNTGCNASCTVLTCSCTTSTNYWSSSSLAPPNTGIAWYVAFNFGSGNYVIEGNDFNVRAVRGGL